MLQALKAVTKTFNELASHVFDLVKSTRRGGTTRSDFIMDQYPEVSIKYTDIVKRSTGGTIQIKVQDGNQKCLLSGKSLSVTEATKQI